MLGYEPEFIPQMYPRWKGLVKRKAMLRLPIYKVRAYIF
jgi:hypothetical protein